jgi:serine/threonine protein kinase
MFDLGEEQGTHYITMEFVDGQDLKKLIRQSGQLAIGTTINIAKQICDGLVEAHASEVIHRDLKPSNIMIDADGNARIMDFGIARSIVGKGITGAGVMIGTPEYMSPEQVEGKEVDQRSDLYSLGVILYEMVTGGVPFEGDTPFTIGMKHKGETPKNPKELNTQISDDLNRLILRCLEKEKDKRYQGAGEVRSELEMIEQGLPTTDRVVSKKKTLTSREITVQFSMKKFFIPGFIIIAIVAVGLMIWSPWKQRETAPIQSDIPSIAVLPFRDLSLLQDQGHLCEGMTIEIIVSLSNLQGWKVMNMVSVLRYKDSPKDPKEIGQELNVKAILLGSVRREDEDIRINVQLVNVEDNFELWSEMYEQKLEGVFTIQSDIAEKIAKALDTEIVQVK